MRTSLGPGGRCPKRNSSTTTVSWSVTSTRNFGAMAWDRARDHPWQRQSKRHMSIHMHLADTALLGGTASSNAPAHGVYKAQRVPQCAS